MRLFLNFAQTKKTNIMKKTLLILSAFVALSASAQIYEANDSTAFAAWTPYDLDQDGILDFAAYNDLNGMSAASYSWDYNTGLPLTPDNLFVSPVLDLSTGSGLMLNFNVTAIDQSYAAEKYAVYIVTNLAAVAAGTFPAPVIDEVLTTGVLAKSIDISAQADGQSAVYVVLRHYDCTDQFAIGFDNLNISGDFASVEENTLTSVNAFPNPATDVLNISTNEPVASMKVMTMDGKVVIENNAVNDSFINVNVNDLEAGMYIYEVATAEGKVSRDSFMKQ